MLVNLSPKEQELLDRAAQGVAVAQAALQAAVKTLPEHEAVVDAHARLAGACDVILSLSDIPTEGTELQINAETGKVEIHTADLPAAQTFRPEVVADPAAPVDL